MKTLIALGFTLTAALSSTAFAGSDHLNCSSPSGIVLSGSLWNSDATVTSISKQKGQKVSVVTSTVLADADSAQLLLDQSKADVVKAIADAKTKLKNPPKGTTYQPDILIVAPLAKPVYSRKEENSACRDFGDMEYTQKAALITVSLEWNLKLKASEVVVRKEPLALTCIYSYATAPGGGPECDTGH